MLEQMCAEEAERPWFACISEAAVWGVEAETGVAVAEEEDAASDVTAPAFRCLALLFAFLLLVVGCVSSLLLLASMSASLMVEEECVA